MTGDNSELTELKSPTVAGDNSSSFVHPTQSLHVSIPSTSKTSLNNQSAVSNKFINADKKFNVVIYGVSE